MKQWKISFARVPWSGEWTSFCAHCDVTCRDQLTASCGCQTVHHRDYWYRALTNDPHQLRTDLENILVRLSIRSRLNVPMILFYTTSTKRSSYGNALRTSSFRLCPAENIFPGSDISTIDRRSLLFSSLLISVTKVFNIPNDRELREEESLK